MGGLFSKKFDPARDIPDLSGKVYLVTGGNAGIGYSTIKHLVRRGATVYMGSRNEEKARAAIARLQAETNGQGTVKFLKLDLCDPRNAHKSAEQFLSQENRLDVLINNAGLIFGDYKKSVDGISDVVMVNHISPFLFTQSLLPLLVQTSKTQDADVRIVNLASEAHRYVPENQQFLTLEDFNKEFKSAFSPSIVRYGVSKLSNILYTRELQRRFDALQIPIISIAVNPGNVNTYADKMWFPWLMGWLMSVFFTHPDVGSYTSAFAAASPVIRANPERYGGAYLEPVGRVGKTTKMAESKGLGDQLWETTTKFLEETVVLKVNSI